MGNFAENLNLGNHVQPPWYLWILYFIFASKFTFLSCFCTENFTFNKYHPPKKNSIYCKAWLGETFTGNKYV